MGKFTGKKERAHSEPMLLAPAKPVFKPKAPEKKAKKKKRK